ncbi:hypothetical protein BDK62_12423 [Halomonas alkaliantarctica]|nr:hypothetical protein BDK62_12423 [Halomonas alkaliantarctica]
MTIRSSKALQAQLRAADHYRRIGHNPEWLRAYDQLRREHYLKKLQAEKEVSPFRIAFARTGGEVVINATDWREAVRKTGRLDACYITADATDKARVEAWFDAESPQGIGAQTVAGALACVSVLIDAQEVGK